MHKISLCDATKHLNCESPLTVVFIDSRYWKVFDNWYNYSINYLKENLLVVSLDKDVNKLLHEKNIASLLFEWDGDLSNLWIERVNVFKQLLELGYDVIHSDADAVWLDDPITYCESLGVDVAFSQGTIWPPKVYDKLGVVLCCGFFYLRSSPQTIELLESWQSAIQVDCDDQKSLNELLMDKGLAWPVKEDYVLNWKGNSFRCFNEVQYAILSNDLELALLPHSLFQRLPEAKAAIVKHPLSEKTGASIEETLIINNCWSAL